jgi:hypothetical protein
MSCAPWKLIKLCKACDVTPSPFPGFPGVMATRRKYIYDRSAQNNNKSRQLLHDHAESLTLRLYSSEKKKKPLPWEVEIVLII